MRKRNVFLLAFITLITAIIVTSLAACEFSEEKEIERNNIDLPEKPNEKYACIYPEKTWEDDTVIEDELPPESFVGTVIEETTSYMIVEPNADEDEYEISKRIRVEYINDHIDYLYGTGRKVVITYISPLAGGTTITTDDIRHNGFEDFTLSVQYRNDSIPARFAEIQYAGLLTHVANSREFDENDIDYNLYYYGLHDVYVNVDGDTLPLKEALSYGKVTLDGIIADCNRRQPAAKSYDDGGSVLYDFGDYRIIKYHTLDGNRDVYIGTSDMDINAKNATAFCIGAYLWKDWGLRLEAKNVTPNGATIVFKQKGGNVTGELQTGEAFWIERLSGNKWVAVDTLPLIDYAFYMVAYMVNCDGETELATNWHWLYGALGGGRYRIAKEVMDFRGTGDFDEQIYYAYFEKPYLPDYLGTDCISIDVFSYEEDLKKYENSDAIVKTSDFINTTTVLFAESGDIELSHISNMDVIIELAMIELGIEDYESYDINYHVDEDYFEDERTMYKISFESCWYTLGENGILTNEIKETNTVYIDSLGKTHLVAYNKIDTVDSEGEAIAIAEKTLYEVYGETINDEKPLKATFNESENYWYVKGTMQELKHGGVAEIKISTDGRILNITHEK